MAEQIVQARGGVIGSVTRLQKWADQITDETSSEALEVRISRLDELYKDFRNLENNLFAFPGQLSKIDEFENSYFTLKELLIRRLRLKQKQPTPTENLPILQETWTELFNQQKMFFEGLNATTTQLADRTFMAHDHVKLPRITIEKFNGEYKNWPAFENSFVSSIHENQSLSEVNKLKLLKGLLTEIPAALIKNLNETDANYTEAWNKLKLRFDKKVKILTSYITSFLDQPLVMSGRASDIRSLADKADEIIIGIRTMGDQAEYRDAWLIQILLRKLDGDTKQMWSKEIAHKEYPTLSEFFEFINTRCDGLDDGITEVRTKDRPTSSHFQAPKVKPSFKAMPLNANVSLCPCCNSSHWLYRCMKFRSYNVKLRRNLVSQTGICFNCLRLGHRVDQCPDATNCRLCNKRHHTLLHEYESFDNSNESHYQQQSSAQPNSINKTGGFNHPQASTQSRSFTQDHTPIQARSAKSIHTNQIDRTQPSNATINKNQPNQVLNTPLVQSLATINVNSTLTNNLCNVSCPQLALLPTALVHIRDINDRKHFANALLDSGSQCTFVTEQLVQRLQLGRTYSSFTVTGLADSHATRTKGQVCIKISSRCSTSENRTINAYILPRLLTLHPVDTRISPPKVLQSLELADPNQGSVREIDILFGADIFFDLLKPDKIVSTGQTYAQSTIFGWIVLAPQEKNGQPVFSLSTSIMGDEVNRTLQRFWELEESPTSPETTPEDELCENQFSQSTQRNESGRYSVRLPFITPHAKLGHSRSAAIRRLVNMERRFERNHELAIAYKKFMNEYLSLGHMEEVPTNEIARRDEEVFYLPHHAILKGDSTTTKMRVVFDGYCKSSSGQSLNDVLIVGPTLQDDLMSIITRFRQHPIVFSADVEKMYRQVLVASNDLDFQRIVWRNNISEEIKTYRLKTVTYGTSCAPFLAVRTLQKIAEDNEKFHPTIAKIIKRDFYVDDLLSGCEDLSTAIARVEDLCRVLEGAGFHLRKWKSNSSELLSKIPNDMKDPSMFTFEDDTIAIKTLGILWNPVRDVFSFVVDIPASTSHSKRNLLSEISRIFDPLGWVSPSTIAMKILFQKLWILKVGWDDKIPINISQTWDAIKLNLRMLEGIQISRHISMSSTAKNLQIHVFCDASEMAYAATAYIRSEDAVGNVKTALIIAKTRVAPIKQVSIPRLELSGACISVKLVKFVLKVFHTHQFQIFAWTDSKTVLAWLSDYPRRWTTFVGNRTSQILEIVPRGHWHYVPSSENPADIASRSISPQGLPNLKLWWEGPKWLGSSKYLAFMQ